MKPKVPGPTPEQQQQMEMAQQENLRATQSDLALRTDYYRRLMSPRLSLAGGKSIGSISIMR